MNNDSRPQGDNFLLLPLGGGKKFHLGGENCWLIVCKDNDKLSVSLRDCPFELKLNEQLFGKSGTFLFGRFFVFLPGLLIPNF